MWVEALLSVVAALLRRLPQSFSHVIAESLAALWWWLIPIRKRVVLDQLARAFPEIDTSSRREIAHGVYRNLCHNVIDVLRLDPTQPQKIRDRIVFDGYRHYERAVAKGRGVLVLTGHLGNWDLLCASQALRGIDLAIVSKNLKASGVNAFWMKSRRACGLKILPDREVKPRLLAHLKQGGTVGFVLDQHAPPKLAVETTFFGRAAATGTGFARLALESGAPVVPIVMIRRPDHFFVMHVLPEIPLPGTGDLDERVRLATQAYTDALEALIRRWPSQWLWLHKRWKIAEKG